MHDTRESAIESYLFRRVKAKGGRACKFVSPGFAGVPDRVVLAPGGKIVFAELKRAGEDMTPLQKKRKREFEQLGFKVYCLDSRQAVDQFIREVFS